MPQQFITQLEQVCRRRGRRRWLTATCWALAAMLVAALVLMGLDRALGIADLWGRGLLTALFVVLCAGIGRRWWVAVSASPGTPLHIAHEVEQRQPALRDLVANAWEFSRQADDDPTAGSEPLRRAIVLRAATAVDDIDWRQLVPRQALRKAAIALACVATTLGILGSYYPQTLGIGLARLMNPINTVEWPREHDLQFVEPPTLLAAGEDLVLQLRDTHGTLPKTILMHYRTRRQGRWHVETESIAATTAPVQIGRSNVQRSLQFRATGADHQTMPWQLLEVVAAPHVEQLQVTVHSPAYTRLPVQPWDLGASIYAGSELELQGRTDQTVTHVVLQSDRGRQLAAHVGAEGRTFWLESTEWRVDSSDTYTLQLTTAAGLSTRAADELTLEVVADRPPQVRFLKPTEDLTVLPTVAVPLVIEASDELALREIKLVYHRTDRAGEGEQRLSLWHATDENVVLQQVEFLWQLEELSLEPGSFVEVHAQATDSQPATGQTVHGLQLKVVSEEQLWHQILEQQARLVETLAQLLLEQCELRSKTTAWAEFPEWPATRWANSSHATLYRQRQIADRLAGGLHSVLGQLTELSLTIERNRLLRPEALDRLQTARGQLQSLIDGPLVTAEQSLSEIVRLTRNSPERKTLHPWITTTGEQQEQVIAGLREVIDLLMPGNVLGRLERELVLIETVQRALTELYRAEILPQMLQTEEPTAEQQTAFAGAVRRQRELARRLAEWLRDTNQAAQRLADEEPALGARLVEAVALAGELGVQATIQAAADQMRRRRLGHSATLQRQTLDDLAKLRSRLAGQDAKGSAERFKKLQATERKLQRLRRQVAAFEQQLRQLSPEKRQRELQRLRRQRENLAEQTEAITRQLERLRLPQAAKPASTAASRLRNAALDRETTKQARKHLDTAQRQLTTARRRQQVALARLEMARLDAKLDALVGRQQSIQQEILRLDDLRLASGQLDKSQVQSTQQLAERQALLQAEVQAQADELTTLPVFAHLLNAAGEAMQRVERQLQKTELGQPTQLLATQAVDLLTQLTKALRQERKKLPANSRDSGQAGGGAGQGQGQGQGQAGDKPQEQTLQLALGQLQLLKSLQTALQEKTEALETQLAAGQTPTHSAHVLARQQQLLTELARQLIPEPSDPPTEKLFPDLEQELQRSLDEITLP